MASTRLRIAFLIDVEGQAYVFAPTLRILAERGHSVAMVFGKVVSPEATTVVIRRLRAEFPAITREWLRLDDHDDPEPVLFRKAWTGLAALHYRAPRFAGTEAVPDRAWKYAPRLVQALAGTRWGRSERGRGARAGVRRVGVETMPPGPAGTPGVCERRPDRQIVCARGGAPTPAGLLRAAQRRPRFGGPDGGPDGACMSAPGPVHALAGPRGGRCAGGGRALAGVLRVVVETMPPGPAVTRWLCERRPDLLIVSALVVDPRQAEFIRAAKRLGIPSVGAVRSWDNLTSKGVIAEVPDVITVWNETQRREAIEIHGVSPDVVVATGAQPFDKWFEREPSRDRSAFCAEAGLDPERPYVLYLASSNFISGAGEPDWVVRWARTVRSRPELEGIGVLVRPHPKATSQWVDPGVSTALGENATIWPSPSIDRSHEREDDDFFDSIFHSAAVVGVNTTALIESAVVGRPVLSVLTDEFRRTQQGSAHFAYLHTVGGGMMRLARSVDEHAEQLTALLRGEEPPPDASAFLREFVRPHGLDRPAAPILADVIERTGRRERSPEPSRVRALLVWPLLRLVARLLAALETSERERERRRKLVRRRVQHARKTGRRRLEHARKTGRRRFRRARKTNRLRVARGTNHARSLRRRGGRALRRALYARRVERPRD